MGTDDYAKASVAQRLFMDFLDNLHTKAEFYNPQLLAVKYKEPQIDEIGTLYTALFNANKAQETKKKQRLSDTEDRTIALNKPYLTLVRVNEAADHIH